MTPSGPQEVERFLRGIEKKHGSGAVLVIKARTNSGKVRNKTGTFLGFRGDQVGLRNEAWKNDKWFAISALVDAWKHGGQVE